MSTPSPRRLSPKVYRRRRAVVLLGLVAVLVVALLIILRPGSGNASTPVGATQTAGSTSARDAAGSGAAGSTPAPGGASSAGSSSAPAADPAASSPTVATDGSAPCTAGNISVAALTDANTYSAGVLPQLSFSILNTGSAPCTINAGTSKQVYTITSGTETYWLSTDCQSDASDTPAMLSPGVAVTSTPFAWNRVRSSPTTCDGAQASVPAGGASYHLKVSVDGIASPDTTQFILN